MEKSCKRSIFNYGYISKEKVGFNTELSRNSERISKTRKRCIRKNKRNKKKQLRRNVKRQKNKH